MTEFEYLTVEQVIDLHQDLVAQVPVLDLDTLTSAVMRCQAGFGGQDAHPTLFDKAAALLHGLSSTQCFQDGNKRIAWIAALVFLDNNGYELDDVPAIEAESFVMAVAVSGWSERTTDKAAEWFATRLGLPRPHRNLDVAYLAREAVIDDDYGLHVRFAYLDGVALPQLPQDVHLTIVARVIWHDDDAGQQHRLDFDVLQEDSGDPVSGGSGHHLFEMPAPSNRRMSKTSWMPTTATVPLDLRFNEPGDYLVRLHMDGVLLVDLPFDVLIVNDVIPNSPANLG